MATNTQKMEKADGVIIPSDPSKIDSTIIRETFALTTQHLKANVCSFLFQKESAILENWSIGSWSTYTQRNYNIKHGNQSDIDNLPPQTRYNAPHRTKRKRKRSQWGAQLIANES